MTSFADERVQEISQRVMTTETLLGIIRRYDLYPKERSRETRDQIIKRMRDDIDVKMISADVVDPRSGQPTKATIAFTVAFSDPSPDEAAKVANELTTLFLNDNVETRTQLANGAATFLQAQVTQVTQHLGAGGVAAVRLRGEALRCAAGSHAAQHAAHQHHRAGAAGNRVARELAGAAGGLPAGSARAAQARFRGVRRYRPARLLDTRSPEDAALGACGRSRDLRRGNIPTSSGCRARSPASKRPRRTRPISTTCGAVSRTRKPSWRRPRSATDRLIRIACGSSVRSSHTSRTSPPRPRPLRRKSLPQSSGPAIQDADNPAYVQIRAQLNATRDDLTATQAREAKLQSDLDRYQHRVTETPLIQKQYQELTQDYEVSKATYENLRAKLADAEIGKNLEIDRKGERFTLIEPPLIPEEPASPNRPLVIDSRRGAGHSPRRGRRRPARVARRYRARAA